MKLYEYQAKQRLSQFGIPVPQGDVARTPDEVYEIAHNLALPLTLKPQLLSAVHVPAETIQYANSPTEAKQRAESLFGRQLRNEDRVEMLLIEAVSDSEIQIYLGITHDRSTGTPLMIASMPLDYGSLPVPDRALNNFASEPIHPFLGLHAYQARALANAINLPYEHWTAFTELASRLSQCYLASDAVIIEINPLVINSDQQFVVLDTRMQIDDYALFRQPEIVALTASTPIQMMTTQGHIRSVQLSGQLACLANGLGLGMTTLDAVQSYGDESVEPGWLIDIGREATESKLEAALQAIRSAPNIRALLLNLFAVVVPCDQIARNILRSFDKMNPQLPTIVRLAGLNASQGIEIIEAASLPLIVSVASLTNAARKAVDAVKGDASWRF